MTVSTSGVSLELSLFGERQIAGELLQTVNRIDNASRWFEMIIGWLEREIGKQFKTKGKHWSTPWPALSETYAAEKRASGYGGKGLLVRDGSLLRALTEGGGGAIREVAPHQMIFGAIVDSEEGVNIGAVHQHGTKDGRIPARPMLALKGETPAARAVQRQVVRSLGMFIARDKVSHPGNFRGK